jgi:hypothetical protein
MTTDTNFMVIDITPAGEVSAMHREQFPLSFLGKQSIRRASEIKFDEGTQKWDVHVPGMMVHDAESWIAIEDARGFASYDVARKFEVRWLEECKLASVHPLSGEGRVIAARIRPEFI